MYNNEVAEQLRKTYGDEKFRIFCEMQVKRHELAKQELNKLNNESDESYEEYFWKVKLSELNKPVTR